MHGLVDYSDDEDTPAVEVQEQKRTEQKADLNALPPPKRRKTTKSIAINGLTALPSLLPTDNGNDSKDDSLFGESLFGNLPCSQNAEGTENGDDDDDPVAEAIRARTRERRREESSGAGFAALLPEPKHVVAPLPCPSPTEDDSLNAGNHMDGLQVTYSTTVTDKNQCGSHKEKVVEVSALDVAAARTREEELLEHVWDSNADYFSNSIRVHISALRKKLRAAMGYDAVHNRIGEGYVMEKRK